MEPAGIPCCTALPTACHVPRIPRSMLSPQGLPAQGRRSQCTRIPLHTSWGRGTDPTEQSCAHTHTCGASLCSSITDKMPPEKAPRHPQGASTSQGGQSCTQQLNPRAHALNKVSSLSLSQLQTNWCLKHCSYLCPTYWCYLTDNRRWLDVACCSVTLSFTNS